MNARTGAFIVTSRPALSVGGGSWSGEESLASLLSHSIGLQHSFARKFFTTSSLYPTSNFGVKCMLGPPGS